MTKKQSTRCYVDYRRYRTGYPSNLLTTTYLTWSGMRSRCSNPNDNSFHQYGGRGVRVCDRWNESFDLFFEDMGHAPAGATLDKDIKGGIGNKSYSPETCMWATPQQQAAHRRTSRRITYKGKTMCIAEWAREQGIRSSTIIYRLNQGWSVHEALTKKGRGARKGYVYRAGRYIAQISVEGKTRYLGCFSTKAEARDAYEQAFELRYGHKPNQ